MSNATAKPHVQENQGGPVLGDRDATATIAVRNIDTAKQFYEGKLGLKVIDVEGDEAVVYQAGSTHLLVYHSTYAGTNKATAVTWTVGDDVDRVVQALKARGIGFEHYDMPGTTRQGDVHLAEGMKTAWFKDPDGNIHAIVSR